MKNSKIYDFIFIGAGASTLQIINNVILSNSFKNFSILIIENDKNKANDRTWSFWGNTDDNFCKSFISKEWNKICFKSKDFHLEESLHPLSYKMIRSAPFYDGVKKLIKTYPNIKIKFDSFVSYFEEKNYVNIETVKAKYKSKFLFNSVINWNLILNQTKYPVLQQHFVGWFIKTDKEHFNSEIATFMDFDINQNKKTSFIYLLPLNKKEALVEYTLFSKERLKFAEYERGIRSYLNKNNIRNYSINEIENGNIPMTCYPFHKHNSKRVLFIGSAGGWTKASTGFTFSSIRKKSEKLVNYIKKNDDLSKFESKNRFWWYDLLFLDVLSEYNHKGSQLFTKMFSKNKLEIILKFLDEETSYYEEIKIFLSFPRLLFVKQLIKRLIRSTH